MPELSERAKPIIQRVFDKAYLEQAVGTAPWGVTESGSCSYRLGCAIGRSLPEHVAEQMGGSIDSLLMYKTFESYYPGIRFRLLGSNDLVSRGDADVACYQRIQAAHDKTWRDQDRELYKDMLELVAAEFGLTVPTPEAAG